MIRLLAFLRRSSAPPPLRVFRTTLTCDACGASDAVTFRAVDDIDAVDVLAVRAGARSASVLDMKVERGLWTRSGWLVFDAGPAVRFVLHEWIDEDAPLDLPTGVLPFAETA